jgi:hypothetical protein
VRGCEVRDCTSKFIGTELIFDGGRKGLYGFIGTTVCSVSPKITNVAVTYSDVIDVATNAGGVAADISGPATFSAVTALSQMVYFSQAIVSNSMGDKLRALIEEVDGDTFTANTTLRTTVNWSPCKASDTHCFTGRIRSWGHRVQWLGKNSPVLGSSHR